MKANAKLSDIVELSWGLCNQGLEDIYGKQGVSGIDIKVKAAWKITKGSPDIKVGIIDTQPLLSHVIFKQPIIEADEEISIVSKNPAYFEEGYSCFHGTFITGIIKMIAPLITTQSYIIDSSNSYDLNTIVSFINEAEKNNVRIMNCSWGSYTFNEDLYNTMKKSSLLFICAAGNDNRDTAIAPYYPACFNLPNTISVGALNSRGEPWLSSNFGSRVEVTAPGALILGPIPSKDKKSFIYNSGTSEAAAFVTGIAALILSNNSKLNAMQVKDAIVSGSNNGLYSFVNAYSSLSLVK